MNPSERHSELYLSETDAGNAAMRLVFPDVMLSPADAARIAREHHLIEQIRIPTPPQPEGVSPALFNPIRWVIRNEDLLSLANFIDLLKASISIAIGASTAGAAGPKAIVDGIHTFYGAFTRIAQKGARLSVEEFAVFRSLKAQGAATPQELEGLLAAEGFAVGRVEIDGILRKYARTEDRGFTRQRQDGSWELDGV